MENGHLISLTNKQTEKLIDIVNTFYARAVERDVLPADMLLLTGGVRRAILDKDSLEQYHIDFIVWLLDLFFLQMEEGDCDPRAEQVYQKLAGWWPVEPPWYEKV